MRIVTLYLLFAAFAAKGQSADSKWSNAEIYTDSLVGTFVLVKGGSFDMKRVDYYSEKPIRQFTLSDYYIGQTEVTQSQWKVVMGNNPSHFSGCDECPVENVSWDDIQTFLQKLNSRSGGVKYRLPTEAEWEYAARGGAKSNGYTYVGSNNIDEVAWYGNNSDRKTHPVKGKLPNELGLYDMSGNVSEWCSDWYGSSYDASRRVVRGGSGYDSSKYCRIAYPYGVYSLPDKRILNLGFRLASNLPATVDTTDAMNAPQMDAPASPTEVYTDSIFGTFVLIQGGSFDMGSNEDESDDKPVHRVTLTDYYIGQTEVTQAQWKAVMGNNPSNFSGCDECPVEQVSWDDIQTFFQKLNSLSGSLKYRMPTEAEWEYAARGGARSKGYTYSGSNNINDVAWYDGNSGNKTHPVKGKTPNELGLYDMSGNVWEWCSDWYARYNSASQINPDGPSTGSNPIYRGGSFPNASQYCTVAYRGRSTPDYRSNYLGFRLARSVNN